LGGEGGGDHLALWLEAWGVGEGYHVKRTDAAFEPPVARPFASCVGMTPPVFALAVGTWLYA